MRYQVSSSPDSEHELAIGVPAVPPFVPQSLREGRVVAGAASTDRPRGGGRSAATKGFRQPATPPIVDVPKQFLFVDESCDPAVAGPSICWSAFIWPSRHLIRFVGTSPRFGTTTRSCARSKVQRWADKLSPQSRHLLEPLADLTDAGQITATANWLRKDVYRRGGGPHGEKGAVLPPSASMALEALTTPNWPPDRCSRQERTSPAQKGQRLCDTNIVIAGSMRWTDAYAVRCEARPHRRSRRGRVQAARRRGAPSRLGRG